MSSPRLVLGSTSRYRAELLRRLTDDFEQAAPGTDETPLTHEEPAERALRLAIAKADAVGLDRRDALVIGSDQVAELDGQLLDKPGDAQRARAQLAASSGRVVNFHTALCLLDTATGCTTGRLVPFEVALRPLTAADIDRYLEREQPFGCAGSLRSEGLGVALCERMSGDDPTALLGLPMIALCELLRAAGVPLP